MLPQDQAERGLVYSLLRRIGEEPEDALLRVAAVPLSLSPDDIADTQLRAILSFILDNAHDEAATTSKIVAQQFGLHEFDIIQAMESVDATAVGIYAKAVQYHSARRQIASAAETALEVAKKESPDAALDRITESFAKIDLVDMGGRIATVGDRISGGRAEQEQWQARMAAGEKRIIFPIPRLNEMVAVLPGEVILLTAQSKVGKSSFAGQMFDANLSRQGKRGVLFHFEDSVRVTWARRMARQMAQFGEDASTPSYKRILNGILADRDYHWLDKAEAIANSQGWPESGLEVHCGGWPMERVIRLWRNLALKMQAAGTPLDFVVIDYLNKAELNPKKLSNYQGVFGSRGRDAELVKQATEATGVVTLLLQQENKDGKPFETTQSLQKCQVWLRLIRERLPDGHRMDTTGQVVVANANNGQTGAVACEFLPKYMAWMQL